MSSVTAVLPLADFILIPRGVPRLFIWFLRLLLMIQEFEKTTEFKMNPCRM
jgi:hypothetical protein